MKSVLQRNILPISKQSFLLDGDFLEGITSCGEWTQESDIIELEDRTRRGVGIANPFDFDMEYDLSNLKTRKIILEWWQCGKDAGATTSGGDAKGLDPRAYRTLTRTYHASMQDNGLNNPSYKLRAYYCYIKSETNPEYAMKSTDPGKGKISVIADYYETLDLKGNILSSVQMNLAKAVPNLPGAN